MFITYTRLSLQLSVSLSTDCTGGTTPGLCEAVLSTRGGYGPTKTVLTNNITPNTPVDSGN